MPKDLTEAKELVKMLYFTINEKNEQQYNKPQIIDKMLKKAKVKISRATISNWERKENWKLKLENVKMAHSLGQTIEEGEFVTYGSHRVKDMLKTSEMGYNEVDKTMNDILQDLITEKRHYIMRASETAQEASLIGRVVTRVKFHQFMKAILKVGIDKVNINKYYTPTEIVQLTGMQNQFVKQMASIGTNTIDTSKLTKEQRDMMVELIQEAEVIEDDRNGK